MATQSISIISPCRTRSPVTRPNWSKWRADPNVDPTAVSGSGAMTPSKRRLSSRRPASSYAELVATGRLLHSHGDPCRQHDVAQVGVGGQCQRRVVRRVEHLPRQPGGVVPHPRSPRHGADVGPHHRVEPAPEPSLRVMEREPGRLGLPPALAHDVEVEPVVLGGEHRRSRRLSSRGHGRHGPRRRARTTLCEPGAGRRCAPWRTARTALIQKAAERMAYSSWK